MTDRENHLEHLVFMHSQMSENDRRIINDLNVKVKQLSDINSSLIYENHKLRSEIHDIKNPQQAEPNGSDSGAQ